ncbi:MAG: sigma-54-dependent Fis family transcriptional regulator [Thermodesulfobacteriota bacterium]
MELQDAKILIVDDEESIRLTFQMFLNREGYQNVTCVDSLSGALAAVAENSFDLVISDIVLEGAMGTDLLKQLRESGIVCPVVMITGFPNLETAAESVRYGAFDYISKPVNKETLLRFTRQALTHWQLENKAKILLQENEKYRHYLEAIFRSVSDAIITVDSDMRIVEMNPTARKWLKDKGVEEFTDLSDLPEDISLACLDDARSVLQDGSEVHEHQVECPTMDGQMRMISLNAAPLMAENDTSHGVVIVARDITLPEKMTESGDRTRFHGYIGSSDVMQEVYRLIENVGKVDTAVLVTGESGTGKELAAEALHGESSRRDKPLVKVDCASIPEELMESELFGHRKGAFTGADRDRPGRLLQADRGTLFLDEIGDISPRTQLRLLRFLQEKTFTPVGRDTPVSVDVRIIAATNVDFQAKVSKGEFREDLYYRLKVVEIQLPPLRKRVSDISALISHFMEKFRTELNKQITSASDQVTEAMHNYSWPGNIRELRHVMERACVLCDGPTLLLSHLPEDLRSPALEEQPDHIQSHASPAEHTAVPLLNPIPDRPEDELIIATLKLTRGNKAKAARILGMDRSTLYRKMQRYDIDLSVAKVSRRTK